MNNLKITLTLTALAASFAWTSVALAQTNTAPQAAEPALDAGNLRAFVELARSDLKTQKALIISENLPMTGEEAAEFWPLQRDYQHELTRLNDEKLAIIRDYAVNFQTMTDEKAAELTKRSFDLEEKKTDLKRQYFKKMAKVMPARKVARFFQLDNQINLAVDLQVAASLPLIK
jgi:hypothetical protein